MASRRGNQRGVVKVVSSLLLAGFGALLSVAGCAADDGTGSGGGEELGVSVQAVTCGKTVCNIDDCTIYKCGGVGGLSCTLSGQAKDGDACKTLSGGTGLCVTLMTGQLPMCCTGCVQRLKTGGYACQAGSAVGACGVGGGACDNCAVSDPCLAPVCDPNKFVCGADKIEDGKPCTDGSGVCTGGKCCTGCFDGGVCQAGNTPKLCGAGGAEKCQNCDDGNPCTDDLCDATGRCVHPAVEAGKSCDTDTNMCNGTAKCDGTQCVTSPAKNCDDGNICTTDTCTAATGVCVYTNNTASCNDGNVCTQVDKCSGGSCVGSSPLPCNDNEACTVDTCDTSTGCKYTAVAGTPSCNDGNDCTTGDRCLAGKCTPTAGKSCDDSNSCTIDACSNDVCQAAQNVPNNTACLPKDRCHVNSSCQNGVCTDGTLLNCDDGNPCTKDSCDPATGCKNDNDDTAKCTDDDLCTVNTKCEAGKCVGSPMTCTAIDDCHLAGTCNAKTGTCDDPRAPDDTECNGGKGKCITGKCDVPTTGEGGAGGEGAGGEGTAGTSTQGGEPATGTAGEGNAPTTGGENGTGGTTVAGGTSNTGATTSTGEGGEDGVPRRVFTREPGGCSCNVPGTSTSNHLAWLGGLSLAALVLGRRRARSADRRAA